MNSFYGTYLSGFLCHVITVVPWILGGFLVLSAGPLAYFGFVKFSAIIIGLTILQYTITIPRWPAFAAWMKRLSPRSYYERCTLDVNVEDLHKEKTLLCYHPHGILCVGFSWNGAHSPELGVGPLNIVFLIVDVLVKAPFFGWVIGWCGNIKGAGAGSMLELMQQGRNLALIPGGFEEATLQEQGVERVVLKDRKGFIKYALRFGYRVHPVYTFGECDTYWTYNGLKCLRVWLNQFKIPSVVFWGTPLMPLFPSSAAKLHTVVGPGIQFPKLEGEALTADEVSKWHATYVAALVELFDKHKAELGNGHRELEVI